MVEVQSPAPWLVALRWLVRLRWAAISGQVLIVGFDWLSNAEASLAWPFGLMAAMAVTNVALHTAQHRLRTSDWLLALVLLFDVGILTALLAMTGGPGNPFSVVFLVYVTLASVVLGARWTWMLVLVTVVAFGALFWLAPMHAMHLHGHAYSLHLQGMWVAFALTGLLIATFVTRIATELRRREAQVLELERRAAVSDKLVALSTLAAGAAHELGTPLGTIAVVAKELERALESSSHAELVTDARLIRTEVGRCRAILNQLSASAGQEAGEMSVRTDLASLSRDLTELLSEAERARVRVEASADVFAVVPRTTLAQILRSLVRNGLDAGSPQVDVSFGGRGARVELVVRDRGSGMTADVLGRAGEPFFTTKPAGKGLGLGLFLARVVIEHLGGTLRLESRPGEGTEARLELPGAPP